MGRHSSGCTDCIHGIVCFFLPEPASEGDSSQAGDDSESSRSQDKRRGELERRGVIEASYRLAGIVGIDPSQYTLRELVWLSHGRVFQEWTYVSSVLAMIANVNRDPQKTPRPFQLMDFHPLLTEEEKREARPTVDIKALKGLFENGSKSRGD